MEEKRKRRIKGVPKAEEEHLESSPILEETVAVVAEQHNIKRNKRALEALFLTADASFPMRVILWSPCKDTLSLLLRCLSRRVGGECTFLNASTGQVTDLVRGAIKVSCSAVSEVFEGEVVEVHTVKDQNDSLRELEVTLRTAKSSNVLRVGPSLAPAFSMVNAGDVVYVDPAAGVVRRLGRAENHADEYDLECDRYVQLSKGSSNSQRMHEATVSLYSMDRVYSGGHGPISDYVRRSVDSILEEYFERGASQVAYSLLIVENAEVLSTAQLTDLNHLVERFPWVRVVLVTSDRSMSSLRLLSKYILIEVAEPENKLDILLAKHPKLADQKYLAAVSEYIESFSVDVLGSLIESCDTPISFKEAMMIF